MNIRVKFKIFANVLIDVFAIIYIVKLQRFNNKIEHIEHKLDNKIVQAFEIVAQPDFYEYLVGGMLFVIFLIGISVFIIQAYQEITMKYTIVLVSLNVIIFLALLIVYSNPIFTSFAVVAIISIGVFANNG